MSELCLLRSVVYLTFGYSTRNVLTSKRRFFFSRALHIASFVAAIFGSNKIQFRAARSSKRSQKLSNFALALLAFSWAAFERRLELGKRRNSLIHSLECASCSRSSSSSALLVNCSTLLVAQWSCYESRFEIRNSKCESRNAKVFGEEKQSALKIRAIYNSKFLVLKIWQLFACV